MKSTIRLWRLWSASAAGVALAAVILAAAGCTSSADTSGFHPAQTHTKEEINQQIAQLKANPRVPAGVKATALKKLEQEFAEAK